MTDIDLAEQIITLRAVIADMETVKRRTPQYDRMIVVMRSLFDRLIAIPIEGVRGAYGSEQQYVLEIELPEESQRDLRQILQVLGLRGDRTEDLGEAIGAALSMHAFLLRETERDKKVVIIDKDGRQRQLLPRVTEKMANGGSAPDPNGTEGSQ